TRPASPEPAAPPFREGYYIRSVPMQRGSDGQEYGISRPQLSCAISRLDKIYLPCASLPAGRIGRSPPLGRARARPGRTPRPLSTTHRRPLAMRWSALLLALSLVLASGPSAQTPGRITGLVTSLSGEPLAGAAVSVVGTTLGALSGPAGRYTIEEVPGGSHTLRASLLGYAEATAEVTLAAGQTATADLRLEPSAVQLEGIVAVGYGTQRREEVTGAVASVSEDEFVQTPARDAASLVAGKIAGLAVSTPSGDPRAGTRISRRCPTTIN